MATNRETAGGAQTLTLPVHEEQLGVRTRTVDTGRGVRIHKVVASRPHTVEQALLHTEVEVRHVPVDRIVAQSEAPVARQEGDTYIVPVLEEVLVLERRLRIKEELHITTVRRQVQHCDTVFLKSEEVSVERFDETSDSSGK